MVLQSLSNVSFSHKFFCLSKLYLSLESHIKHRAPLLFLHTREQKVMTSVVQHHYLYISENRLAESATDKVRRPLSSTSASIIKNKIKFYVLT